MSRSKDHRRVSLDFVGREAELARIREAAEDVAVGPGKIILIEGEAGIGKTRLVEEVARIAAGAGFAILKGRCFEEEGTPLRPWIEVLRAGAEAIGWQTVKSILKDHFQMFASDIPILQMEKRDFSPEDDITHVLGSTASLTFNLAFRMQMLIERIGQESPVLLLFDDIQWADELSLEVLRHIAWDCEGSHLLLLVTHRSTGSRANGVESILAQLQRTQVYSRIFLPGLSEIDVSRYLELVTHRQIDDLAARQVQRITNGNPFFVSQVAAEITGGPVQNSVDLEFINSLDVPEGISLLVGMVVSRLDNSSRMLLEYLSLIGQEFSLEHLIGLPEYPDTASVMRHIDRISASKIIVPLPGLKGMYRFDHDLVKMAVQNDIQAGRKMSMHANLAARLERRWGELDERHAAEIFHHLRESGPLDSSGKTALYALRAGKFLLSTGVITAAVRILEDGLAACDADAVAIKADIHVAIGRALNHGRAMEPLVAHNHFSCAIDEYEKNGDTAAIARLALIPQTFGFAQLCYDDRPLVIDRVAARTRPGTKEHLYCRAIIGLHRMYIDINDGPNRKLIHNVLRKAARRGYRELERETHHQLAHAYEVWGDYEAGMIHFKHALEFCSEESYRDLEAYVHYSLHVAMCLRCLERHEEEDILLRGLMKAPGLESRPDLRAYIQMAAAYAAVGVRMDLSGQLRELSSAEAIIQSTAGDVREIQLAMAVNAFHRGDIGEMRRLIDPVAEEILGGGWHFYFPGIISIYVLLTGDRRWEKAMAEMCRSALESPSASSRGAIAHIWKAGLAATAVDRDIGYARELYSTIDPANINFGCPENNGHLEVGLIAWRLGERDTAADLLRKTAKESGCWSVWSLLKLGQLLNEMEGSESSVEAAGVLEKAVEKAESIGMSYVADEARTTLAGIKSAEIDRKASSDKITPREFEVLQLLATGMVDKEIAGELDISTNTVHNHVRNILRKTGAGNRTEAAMHAVKIGLVGKQ